MFRKQRVRLEKNLAGIQNMPGIPQVVFVVDANREDIAVREAIRLNIPCIGIVDTNCDPETVSLAVPGNDDAIRAVSLFCSIIADAAIEGKTRAEKTRADELAEAEKEDESVAEVTLAQAEATAVADEETPEVAQVAEVAEAAEVAEVAEVAEAEEAAADDEAAEEEV